LPPSNKAVRRLIAMIAFLNRKDNTELLRR
jgi:hypothetical protein